MQLSTIPKDSIINMAEENGGQVVSNFLLHGLKIKNDTGENIILKDISFELYSAGVAVKQVTYQGKYLDNAVENFAENNGWLCKDIGAKLFLGEEDFWNAECFAKSVVMNENQETGIFNEYFITVHESAIDELRIKVAYDKFGEKHVQELSVPLVQYENKNQYIFPLKGSISTCGHYKSLLDHRQHYSMEFAIDMAQYNVEQKLSYKENMSKEDYVVYGKDVLAIADGEVVDCYHSFEITTSWNWSERKPFIDQYGFMPAQCGNHIVLKHDNEEYSFYGHLATDSLTVKKGDKVKQGQVIAKVGHTGMSGCPHLHFQLMDGPDFLADRGLPCSFSNIRNVDGDRISLIEEENIIVHAE
ncbi:M23 family metallopeptidase [Oceanirhabdus seepicola]|uniref:M23 family metallopeptidase n=1 Tax=Oceanirhabdus seepicola TaxID=2828781 RepID=A0A9J6NX48_9CLOT|nr:M23 family metallopeptidase [Oceanirhabdus seepicola]MCM1989087.1 M23 family metallopeptidase [Oceanirhabdus seepicola]